MSHTDNSGYLLPEQVWDNQAPGGDQPGTIPGTPTLSATPLAWTHAQFIRLAQDVAAGAVARAAGGGRRQIRELMARILVADNDPQALELALLDLRLEGHTVLGAPDAPEHLRICSTSSSPTSSCSTTGCRPARPGSASRCGCARERPDLRVVVYSNYQDVELVRQARDGGVPFLPKGNLRTLRAAVRG